MDLQAECTVIAVDFVTAFTIPLISKRCLRGRSLYILVKLAILRNDQGRLAHNASFIIRFDIEYVDETTARLDFGNQNGPIRDSNCASPL